MDRIAQMIIRQVVSRVVRKGFDTGEAYLSARRNQNGRPAEPTPERSEHVGRNGGNASQAMRLARRVNRF